MVLLLSDEARHCSLLRAQPIIYLRHAPSLLTSIICSRREEEQRKGSILRDASTGDPAKLIHHLGLGVWSFLASPASGLVEGARRGAPERIAAGMLEGTRGLLTNTVYAFSNATAKISGTARKV